MFLGPTAVRDSGFFAEAQSIVGDAQGAIPGLASLLSQAGDNSTVIISHESLFGHPDTAGFYGSNGGRRTLIRCMLAGSGQTGEFVFYYKKPHKLIESYYRHHVMHGGKLGPMEYLERVPLLEMSFVALKNDLDTLAGADRVTMLDARIENADVFFRRFCAALNLVVECEMLSAPSYTNKSWSALKTELARIANARISPAERAGWLRAMTSTPLGEDSDAPIHQFLNLSVDDVRSDLTEVLALLRTIRPGLKVILTVSPVPLKATASSDHVLTATSYSKSVLRREPPIWPLLSVRILQSQHFPAWN